MKTAFGYDGWAQSCGEEVCKTLVAGKGYGDRCDSIPKVLVRAFNFELFASPPPETVDALCACRAGDWMLVQRSQGFRAGSFGQFLATDAAGTLDCGHMAGVGNGTPCLVLCYDGYNQSTSRETSIPLRSAMGGTERNDADTKVLCPPPCYEDFHRNIVAFDPYPPTNVGNAVYDDEASGTLVCSSAPGHHQAVVQFAEE